MIPGQLIVPAAVVGLGFLSLMAISLLIGMAWTAASWWQDRRARRHDVGPDALRLLETLDKHLDSDPEVRAGFARLDAAVRGEREKGEIG